MKRTSKYHNHKTCSSEREAQALLETLATKNPSKQFRVQKKQWQGKDKVKYQVQELTRKGSKRG